MREVIDMPARDGTGPAGMGPMTGRGLGPCGEGMGFRRGLGRGFGIGLGRGFRAAPAQPYGQPYGYRYQPTREDEVKMLEAEMADLQAEMKEVQARLKELKSTK